MTASPSPSSVPGPNRATREAINVARAALGCSVEFVVIEPNRTLVAAGTGEEEGLRPRSLHPCERKILAGAPIGIGPYGTAVAVDLGPTQPPGALFATGTLDTSGIAILAGLANLLSASLATPGSETGHELEQELAQVADVERGQRDLVRQTLDTNQLVMFFQPIVDIDSRPVAVEALARVKNAAGEIVAPAGFLDAIEGTRLMVSLDHRAFELSCRAAATLRRDLPETDLYVACNFSATTLREPDLAFGALRMIEAHNLSPAQLCVEVTETAVFEAGVEQLSMLRDAGVRIALDNFGTGYAEISGLRDLPLSGVKIDRSFTAALDKSGTEEAIAAMVLEMAKSLGLAVVAEGVENARQWRAARNLGIDTMQGWFYSPAIPFGDLLTLFRGVPTAPAATAVPTAPAATAVAS